MRQVIALGIVLGAINSVAILGDRFWGSTKMDLIEDRTLQARTERKQILDNQARIESYLIKLTEANIQLSKAVDRMVVIMERK